MSDGEVNELIATLERSNLRRTAAVFKSRFDALTAENERLTRELGEAGDEFGRIAKKLLEGTLHCGICSADHRKPIGSGSCCCPPGREIRNLRHELAAAQQRLAALAVDPTKREELGAKALELQQSAFAAISRNSWKHIDNEFAQEGWMRCGEGMFNAGRIARDPEVAELERQLDEANKRLAELRGPEILPMEHGTNCGYFDSESECTCGLEWRKALQTEREMHNAWRKRAEESEKRLAELTKPADEEELGGINYTEYYRDLSNPTKAWMNAADAVAACVRGPLVQQIAELNEKLEAAHERIKGQCEQIGNHGRCIVRQRETIKRFKADRDRLAAELAEAKRVLSVIWTACFYETPIAEEATVNAMGEAIYNGVNRTKKELSTTKQALADARAQVERVRAACEPARMALKAARFRLVEYLDFQAAADCRDAESKLKAVLKVAAPSPSPSLANPAASEPIGLCPKCGIQPLTKEGGDMIRLGEKDYLCGNCKRYLCRPIEPKGAASERGDSSHTVETAHTSSSQSAPADHSGEANEKVEPAERRFVCPECEGTLFSTDMEGILYCQTMSVLGACGWSGTWTEVEAAKGEGGDRFRARIYDKLCKRLGKEAADALITESDAAVAEFETAVAMIEKYGYVVMSDSQQGILEQRLAAANQAREAERQKREQAEAAAGVMKTALTNGDELNLNNNRGVSIYDALRRLRDGSMATPDNSWFGWAFDRIDKALATDPGRAANERRAGKALAGKVRDALCTVEAIAHVERALADYDQALAQGEQCGEGQHGR